MLALTHLPSPNLDAGQRTHVARLPIDHGLVARQHEAYCATLEHCRIDVRVLDVNRHLPDAFFIEDTAIVLDEIAIVTRLGTEARRDESAAIARVLKAYHPLEYIQAPATLEGGDVLRVGRRLLVGLSARTNFAGVQALENIARRFGYRVSPVAVYGCLHLKTACTALPDGSLLVNPSWVDLQSLADFMTVPVPEPEPWAANTLPLGSTVLLAAEHPRTAELLQGRGLDVRLVALSEFAKAEGGVTCLALFVNTE
jgi:dimethylargininase